MDFLDALGHLCNFAWPALAMALLTTGLAKLFWRSDLRPVAWSNLIGWAASAGLLAWFLGLVLTGHDGRMGSYLALVLANALGLWWAGFGPGRR